MKVSQLIAQLSQCHPDAEVEIRGTVDEGYLIETDIAVDNADETLVVIDI